MDAIYQRINDDLEASEPVGESEVQKYYAGKTILITGSTGFMGKALMEKLLRGCPDLKKIYILVRPKRGSSPEERIKKYFTDVIFGPLREINPDFPSKIHLIEGDLIKNGMDLSEEDKNTIINEVNLIFHNASNVKFTERICNALRINAVGTHEMLQLAKQCKHIEGFLYVSTAYSHSYRSEVYEEAYPSPAGLDTVRELIAADERSPKGLSDADITKAIGKFPNTYTFTKAVAEGMVNEMGSQVPFPCIVYRPSIVMSAFKEPLRGWVGNWNGPAMLFISYGLGIVHTAYKAGTILDFIPVDLSINGIIVSMWDSVKNRPKRSGAEIFNYGSSTENPMSLEKIREIAFTKNGDIAGPSIKQLWHPFAIFTDNMAIFMLYHVLFHFIPAVFADLYLLCKGMKPQAVAVVKKVTVSFSAIMYFNRAYPIHVTEMLKAIDRLNPVDQELFFCDMRKLDWYEYGQTYAMGLRYYAFKESMDTLPAAIRKARYFKIAHITLKYALLLLFVYYIATKLGLL